MSCKMEKKQNIVVVSDGAQACDGHATQKSDRWRFDAAVKQIFLNSHVKYTIKKIQNKILILLLLQIIIIIIKNKIQSYLNKTS